MRIFCCVITLSTPNELMKFKNFQQVKSHSLCCSGSPAIVHWAHACTSSWRGVWRDEREDPRQQGCPSLSSLGRPHFTLKHHYPSIITVFKQRWQTSYMSLAIPGRPQLGWAFEVGTSEAVHQDDGDNSMGWKGQWCIYAALRPRCDCGSTVFRSYLSVLAGDRQFLWRGVQDT